jgi:hypothetical protein
MEEDVYVGIDVSKTELVVAVRPGGESFRLAYDRAGLKQLVGRLGKLQSKLVVVEATGGLQRQVVAALQHHYPTTYNSGRLVFFPQPANASITEKSDEITSLTEPPLISIILSSPEKMLNTLRVGANLRYEYLGSADHNENPA